MPNNSELHSFYTSKRWRDFRRVIISERKPVCETCRQIIIDPKDIEVDHNPIELTVNNVHDANVSLNPDNVKISCHDCHNKRHGRFGKTERGVYIIYGPPCSGKMDYVLGNMQRGDLIVDMDRLYTAVSLQGIYDKPDELIRNVFAIHDLLIDNIKTRYGKWHNAWIVGGYPEKYKREKFAEDLGAELIYVEATKEECLERLAKDKDRGIRYNEYSGYINKWFERYEP